VISALGLLVLAAIWLELVKTPRADRPLPHGAGGRADVARPGSELLVPRGPVPGETADGSGRAIPATDGTASAPPRARIRGRVVMEDTLEPLAQVLSIRLRTVDLALIDAVETLSDGSFVSHRTFVAGGVLAHVRTAEGRELVDHEGHFDPGSSEPWLVLVPEAEFPTSVSGRVVDLSGDPAGGVMVFCGRPSGPESLSEYPCLGETDAEGAFEIHGLAPGSWELRADGGHAHSSTLALELSRGEFEAGTLVLPSPGALRGRLVADVEPRAYFFVREIGTGRELWLDDRSEEAASSGVRPFRITGLPAGEYEISLVPLDGRNYEPASLRARPPATGLEFRAVSSMRTLELSVLDSSSEVPLPHEAFTRVRGRWLDGFHPQGERWLVWSDGYRPANLGPSALPTTDETPGRVTVRLERGWSQLRLYQVRELAPALDTGGKWSRPPLCGVCVCADGLPVATSDEDGIAIVGLERAPGNLDERLIGWRTDSSYAWRGMTVVQMTRE